MKKTTDTGKRHTEKGAKRRVCFMAYTLNNTQPVICTLVSDQPYFYMEDEQLPEEDDILGLEDYEDFDRDMAELQKKLAAFERLSNTCERDPLARIEDMTAAIREITDVKNHTEKMLQAADVVSMTLSRSRMGKALLDFAHDHNVTIVESDQVEAAQYDRGAGKIFIHPQTGEHEMLLLSARELRRHWQHRKGVMIHPLTFHPDQAILINRAQEADLTIAMVRVAWELQLAGMREVWDFVEQSPFADVARAFAREAFVDFRSLMTGKASSAAFETWFLSERCRHQDKKLIQAMLADHQGYVFSSTEASKNVSMELIAKLGLQPFGKNYLAPYAQTILDDPIFMEVRDRSNANFLWFIKFERSFNEAEQALQSETGSFGPDVLPAQTPTQTGQHDPSTGNNIVSLSTYGVIHKGGGRKRANLDDASDTANVICVPFGNGRQA